jgi:hypothetical protein
VSPRDLIFGQTDRDLRFGHTRIIPRRFVLRAAGRLINGPWEVA